MDEVPKTNDIVDTTDCLEAISAFKGMKNLLFTIALICLLVLQGIFWLNYTGRIDKGGCPHRGSGIICPWSPSGKICPKAAVKTCPKAKAAVKTCPKAKAAAEASVKTSPKTDVAAADNAIDKQAQLVTKDVAAQSSQADKPEAADKASNKSRISELFIFKCSHMADLIKACNFILIIVITVYTLTLFMSIKISITGRLGGINHISRAFFMSLFIFVFILPWQLVFPGVIAGAIYTPTELLCAKPMTSADPLLGEILYYLRFTGLWSLVLVMLVGAQLRTGKWSKATFRRLGVLQ